jgi:hypothetical protein
MKLGLPACAFQLNAPSILLRNQTHRDRFYSQVIRILASYRKSDSFCLIYVILQFPLTLCFFLECKCVWLPLSLRLHKIPLPLDFCSTLKRVVRLLKQPMV